MNYTFYHTKSQSSSFAHSDSGDSVLYHYGILGMKWGVRRYQNEDGSLTPAGRERYRKLYMKYSDAYHTDGMNRNKVSRAFRKFRNFSSGLHKDAQEHNVKPSDAQRLHRELEEEAHKKYVDGLEVSEKYASLIKNDRKQGTLNALENPDAIVGENDSEYDKHTKKLVAISQDCTPFSDMHHRFIGDYNGMSTDEMKQRAKSTADLGIKTILSKPNKYDYGFEKNTEIDDEARDWFLYGDGTVGLGMVTDLINRGYTPKQVGKMAERIQSEYKDLIALNHGRPMYQLSSDPKDKNLEFTEMVANTMLWAGDPSKLEAFAEDVYKVKKGS